MRNAGLIVVFLMALAAGVAFSADFLLNNVIFGTSGSERRQMTEIFSDKLHPMGQFVLQISEGYPADIVASNVNEKNPHIAQFLAYCPNHEPIGYLNKFAKRARSFSEEETRDCDAYFSVVTADLERSVSIDHFIRLVSRATGLMLLLVAVCGLALEVSKYRRRGLARDGE